jgi:hypothetical protein
MRDDNSPRGPSSKPCAKFPIDEKCSILLGKAMRAVRNRIGKKLPVRRRGGNFRLAHA